MVDIRWERGLGAPARCHDRTGLRHKGATGPDRDPWGGSLGAVLELESRGLKGLAAIVRKYIEGKQPTPEVQTQLDHIVSINGRPGLDSQ
jgi:hypothetical protein